MTHDDYKQMISAHALSALDAADERALNEHLAKCASCRRDFSEFQATAAKLALSADPLEPSKLVREKLLARIRSEKSVSSVVPLPSPRRNVWNSLGSVGSIAAIVIFLALVVGVVLLWQQNRRLRERDEILQLILAPGTRVAQLSGTAQASSASAKLAYNQNGHAVLIVDNLPQAPAGKAYQLWYIVDNKPVAGKTFVPGPSGRGLLNDQIPEEARKSAVFAVTLEPAGGVAAPTGAIYLLGKL